MKKFIIALLTFTLLTSQTIYAQDEKKSLPPIENEGRIIVLDQGDSTPFAGVLFDPLAVAKIIAEREMQEERLRIEIEHAVAARDIEHKADIKLLESQCKVEEEVLQARIDTQASEIEILEDELKKADHSLSPGKAILVGIAGFAAGTLAGGLIVLFASK